MLDLGKKEVGRLSKRDRFIAGISLYAGDGLKGDKQMGFANSDPRLISFVIGWLREFGGVPENKLRGAIWIHDNLNAEKAKAYWSKVTGISKERFYKTYVALNKTRSKKVRKQLHEYGVFAIRISDASLQRKVLGWMAGLVA